MRDRNSSISSSQNLWAYIKIQLRGCRMTIDPSNHYKFLYLQVAEIHRKPMALMWLQAYVFCCCLRNQSNLLITLLHRQLPFLWSPLSAKYLLSNYHFYVHSVISFRKSMVSSSPPPHTHTHTSLYVNNSGCCLFD